MNTNLKHYKIKKKKILHAMKLNHKMTQGFEKQVK